MTIKLITFDLDNTLWPVDQVIRCAEKTSALWLHKNHPGVSARFDVNALIAVRNKLVKETPQYRHNLTALRKAALTHAFLECGYSILEAKHSSDAAFRIFHDARNQVTPFPHALETLERLSQRYQLGTLTNGNADLQKIGLAHFFRFQHSSESIGKRKPEADMFYAALRDSGASANESIHIGDHPSEDIGAALTHGFSAIWANVIAQPWPNDMPPPQYRFNDWQQLPALLEEIDDQKSRHPTHRPTQ